MPDTGDKEEPLSPVVFMKLFPTVFSITFSDLSPRTIFEHLSIIFMKLLPLKYFRVRFDMHAKLYTKINWIIISQLVLHLV